MSLPTTQQVIDYVRENPNCKSKAIANHFKCNTKDINRDRVGYVGVYKNPEIVSENYTHRLTEVPEPEAQPIDNERPSFFCCITREQVQGFPVMLGCCADGTMSKDAYLEYIDHSEDTNAPCPACRSKLYPEAWTVVWHNGPVRGEQPEPHHYLNFWNHNPVDRFLEEFRNATEQEREDVVVDFLARHNIELRWQPQDGHYLQVDDFNRLDAFGSLLSRREILTNILADHGVRLTVRPHEQQEQRQRIAARIRSP